MAVSTSAMVRRTREGKFNSPTPGSSMTMVPTRANVSRNAAASTGRNETSTFIYFLTAGDAGSDPQHLRVQPLGHERQRDQQRNEDRQFLRNEGEGHFLDLRDCLQQRNGDAYRQAHQHDWTGDDDERVNGVAGDVENFGSGHYLPLRSPLTGKIRWASS